MKQIYACKNTHFFKKNDNNGQIIIKKTSIDMTKRIKKKFFIYLLLTYIN